MAPTQPPSLFARAARVAIYASVVHTYWRPQETLRLFGIGDEDLLAHVVRFLLTIFTYCFAASYVSWFYYIGTAIFLQSACWVLYISKDRYLPFELDAATEKTYLELGAVVCYAALAWIIFFGGAAEERRQLRNRLVTFYTKHNPEKLDEVDALLEKYAGNEELLFSRLHRKYNSLAGDADGGKRTLANDFDESAFLYEQSDDENEDDDDKASTFATTSSPVRSRAASSATSNNDDVEDDNDNNDDDADNEASESANDRSTGAGSQGGASGGNGSSSSDDGFEVVKAPRSPQSVRKLSLDVASIVSSSSPTPTSFDGGAMPSTPPGKAHTSVSSTRIQTALASARRAQEDRVAQRIAQLMQRASANAAK